MPQNAWSLLIFTLFTQMSVGAFCVGELIHLSYSREFGFKNFNPLRYISLAFIFLAAALAGVSAIFHLKKWAHAYYAFNNLKTSWVSKEMVLFFLFVFFVAFLAFLSWRKIEANLIRLVMGIAGALSGLALIYAMANIYMLPTIPSWDYWTTPGLFFTSAFLLGTLSIVCLYSTTLRFTKSASHSGEIRERWRTKTFPTLLKLLLFFIVTGILITGLFSYRVMAVAEEFGSVADSLILDKQILLYSRVIFYVFGWILILLGLKKARQHNEIEEKILWLVYAAFILIALAEIGGRYFFYASFYRLGA